MEQPTNSRTAWGSVRGSTELLWASVTRKSAVIMAVNVLKINKYLALVLCLRTECVKGENLLKISQLSERRVILHQVVHYREMETAGNSSYSLVNEEKGVIPCGQSRVMGFCMAVMRLLDSCWTGAVGQFQQTQA